jgi:putative hemolysin
MRGDSLISITDHFDLTDTLVVPTSDPKVLYSTHSLRIGNFLTARCFDIDWLQLFRSGKKSLETLSPIQTALYQYICTTVIQTTIWSQTTSVHMDITDFQEWGWHKDSSGRWLPYWTALEDISKACSIQLQCG